MNVSAIGFPASFFQSFLLSEGKKLDELSLTRSCRPSLLLLQTKITQKGLQ